jgi:phosphoribosyl 1,2-cyclic phosphodiesterase
MQAIFFGVRGTAPAVGPDFARYGGHTTAVLVTGRNGDRIAIDAGTGARDLGLHLLAHPSPPSLLVLMTHYHLDHVAGLGSLSPLYEPEWRVRFAAPRREGVSVREAVSGLLRAPYWPVPLARMKAEIEWKDLGIGETDAHGGLRVRFSPVHHENGCSAYRIDEPETGASFVFATDVEWAASTEAEKTDFLRLCAEPSPASVLVFDGHFTEETIAAHTGWGHSAAEEAAAIAREGRVARLLVTHHAPDRTDAALDEVEKRLTGMHPDARLARQGMVIRI